MGAAIVVAALVICLATPAAGDDVIPGHEIDRQVNGLVIGGQFVVVAGEVLISQLTLAHAGTGFEKVMRFLGLGEADIGVACQGLADRRCSATRGAHDEETRRKLADLSATGFPAVTEALDLGDTAWQGLVFPGMECFS